MTRRAAGPHLALALWAARRQLRFELLEVALDVPAVEAERDPVAERPATLLPQPVGGAAHALTLAACLTGRASR